MRWLQLASLTLAVIAVVSGLIGVFAPGARLKLASVVGVVIGASVVAVVWIIPLNGARGPFGHFGQVICSSAAA